LSISKELKGGRSEKWHTRAKAGHASVVVKCFEKEDEGLPIEVDIPFLRSIAISPTHVLEETKLFVFDF